MRLLQWILKHLSPQHNDRWNKQKEVKYITMDLDGKLKVTKYIYEK